MKTLSPSGFTLHEILIYLGIVALLIVLVLPSYHAYMAKQEGKKITDILKTIIHSAKYQASLSHQNVVICPSKDQQSCQNNAWSNSLLIFIDPNRNRQHEPDEKLLNITTLNLKYGALNWKGSLKLPSLTFQGSSGLPHGSIGSFYYCAENSTNHQKFIINMMGHTRVEQPKTC